MELFVPGRLCILGEHTDWIASYRNNPQLSSPLEKGVCIVCATNEGLYARCTENLDTQTLSYSCIDNNGAVSEFELTLNDAASLSQLASRGDFFSYVAGTAAAILERYSDKITSGITISNYKTTLPMKKGLSSSAAVCVLIVRCFDSWYNLNLSMEGTVLFVQNYSKTINEEYSEQSRCLCCS